VTQSLSWNLHGNDQLSGVLERLDRTVSQLSRQMNSAAGNAREYGRAIGTAEVSAQRFQGSVKTTGSHLDGLTSKLAGVASMLRGIAVTGAVALGSAAAAAGAFGIQMAAANESAAISFELMLGSAEKAQEFLGQLLKFAAATPFEMPQLRSAASRLLAVGVAASDIIPLLTTLGDATAGMGTGAEGIERAVTALTQMKQKTKVTGEEMMQLTEAGIPAWETLAAKLGVDVATAMDMVTKREVDAGVIFAAVQEKQGTGLQRLTGMMQRQSTTLAGLWSTFKDNAGQALATFAEPAIPGIKKLLDFVSTALPAGLQKIKDMTGQVTGIFAGSDVPEKIMNSLKELGQKVLPALREAWDKIVTTISNNKEGLEKLGRFISDVAIPLFGTSLVSSIELITGAFQGIIWMAARVVDVIKFFTEMFLINLGFIIHSAEQTFGWIPGLGPQLRKAADDFDAFARSVMDKLNALDGKTVNVNVAYHEYRAGERYSPSDSASSTTYSSGGQIQEFAYGGTVQGPPGSAQMVIAHAGEEVLTPEQQRSRSQPDETVLAPLSINVEGYGLWQGMLAFKRRSGKVTLGLA